jgi:hypothetical protein
MGCVRVPREGMGVGDIIDTVSWQVKIDGVE